MSPIQNDRKRILCVEDDLDTCDLLQISFMLYGGDQYGVVIATTLVDGIRLARSERFDLYLIDERLPDGSGIDLTRQIRAFDSSTPLIFHSASAYDDDICRGLDAGAQAYIIKPSDPSVVVDVVKILIAESEKSRSHHAAPWLHEGWSYSNVHPSSLKPH